MQGTHGSASRPNEFCKWDLVCIKIATYTRSRFPPLLWMFSTLGTSRIRVTLNIWPGTWLRKSEEIYSTVISSPTRLNFASKTVHLDWYLNLTFEGHPRSKIFSSFESPYMTSYLISIDTFSLSRTVFEIFDFKVFGVWLWPLTFRGHLRSKIFPPFESPYMTSYSNPIDTFYLVPFSRYSTSKVPGFDLDLWPLGVTLSQKYFHHLKAHIWLPIQLPLTLSLISYRFRDIRLQSF